MEKIKKEIKTLNLHYSDLADQYNDAYSYLFDKKYHTWLVNQIVRLLDIGINDTLIDMGGGAGSYANLIHKRKKLKKNILCVDKNFKLLEIASQFSGITTFCEDALSFTSKDNLSYSKILMKEVVHHFHFRMNIWKGVYKQLEQNGRLLIITRPPESSFPFFKEALNSFKKNQPNYEIFKRELEGAGFYVKVTFNHYPLLIDKKNWFYILRQRFMSNLAEFSDKQIENGIEELKEKYNLLEKISFHDTLIFILGLRKRDFLL